MGEPRTDSDAELDRIQQVILWMVSGLSEKGLRDAAEGKLGLGPSEVPELLAEARRRLTVAAEYNRDEMIGTALTRLNDIYGRCVRSEDWAKALQAQKEINRLADLYAKQAPEDVAGGGEDGSGELEGIAQHLLPLGLLSEEYPLSEHARVAAERIRDGQGKAPTRRERKT